MVTMISMQLGCMHIEMRCMYGLSAEVMGAYSRRSGSGNYRIAQKPCCTTVSNVAEGLMRVCAWQDVDHMLRQQQHVAVHVAYSSTQERQVLDCIIQMRDPDSNQQRLAPLFPVVQRVCFDGSDRGISPLLNFRTCSQNLHKCHHWYV